MNLINRENYGMFIIDYLEGRLTAPLAEELMSFLDLHPELKEEFEDFQIIRLAELGSAYAEQAAFAEKEQLKHDIMPVSGIDGLSYEHATIAALEGDLPAETRKDLDVFYELNPGLQKVQLAYHKTRVIPDMSVSYAGKEKLRKHAVVPVYRKLYYSGAAAAALVLLALVLGWVFEHAADGDKIARINQVEPWHMPGIAFQELTSVSYQQKFSPGDRSLSQGQLISYAGEDSGTEIAYSYANTGRLPLSSMPMGRAPEIITGNTLYSHQVYPRAIPGTAADITNEKSILGKIFAGLTKSFTNKANIRSPEETKEARSFWDVAIKGYNSMTDRNLEIQTSINPDGEVTGYVLTEYDEVLLSRAQGN